MRVIPRPTLINRLYAVVYHAHARTHTHTVAAAHIKRRERYDCDEIRLFCFDSCSSVGSCRLAINHNTLDRLCVCIKYTYIYSGERVGPRHSFAALSLRETLHRDT